MISPTAVKIISHLPKGLVKFLSKTILNGYINKYANVKVEGKENLEGIESPILFVCNHLSNSDALVLNKALKDYDLTFVAGVKLSSNPLTNLGISITKTIPIKPNTADKDAISNIVKTLKRGENVLVFPEGTRSRSGSLMEAKKGILLIEKLSKATLIPVGMCGTEKLLPINTKDMGAEEFNYADITVNIGEKINVPKKLEGEDRHEYENRAVIYIMKSIAQLVPEEYKGVYK